MVDTMMTDDEKVHEAARALMMMSRQSLPGSSSIEPIVPYWLDEFIRDNNGVEPRKIIEKELTETDVSSKHTRLSMPFSQIIYSGFLTKDEEKIVRKNAKKKPNKGLDSKLVCYVESEGSYLMEFNVSFKIWEMTSSPIYNLVTGWNEVVEHYGLKKDDQICVWSFHCNDELYFALV